MKSLVLVDLDNLMPHPWAPLPAPQDVPIDGNFPTKGPATDELVVVFGMNTATAQRLSEVWLQQLGQRILEKFSVRGTLGPIEYGLVLVMPEAVDDLLLRLLHEAGHPQNTGKFGRVWLLSGDKGLRSRVAKKLGASSPENRGACTRIAASFQRTYPPSPARGAATGVPPSGPLTRPVDSEEACAWAYHQGLWPGQCLSELAFLAEQEPWLATQIGPTETSVAGVFRLGEVLAGREPALSCLPEDGLEVATADPFTDWMPARYPDEITPSSLGRGALIATWAREDVRAMLRSRLPWWVVSEIAAAHAGAVGEVLPLGLGGVVDDAVALVVRRVLGFPAEHQLRVRLSKRGAESEARIAAELESEADAWWWIRQGEDVRCTRKLSVRAAPHHPMQIELPEPIDARLGRVRVKGQPQLICVATVDGGATVEPRRRIAANQIGLAFSAEKSRCGVLALGAPVAGEVEVVPIQHLRVEELQAASQFALRDEQLEELRLLPLVVPLQAISGVS